MSSDKHVPWQQSPNSLNNHDEIHHMEPVGKKSDLK